jgi:dTDP-4-dehydrorhamnose reductase
VVDGWVTKPSYSLDIVRAIEEIVNSDVTGLWHFANGPAVSRFEFARGVLELLGSDPERIRAVSVDALTLPAARPARTPLSTRRFEARFARKPKPWTEWARGYLALHPPKARA